MKVNNYTYRQNFYDIKFDLKGHKVNNTMSLKNKLNLIPYQTPYRL